MTSSVPLADLAPWFYGGEADRAEVARRVDEALCASGFLLIAGHGVPDSLRGRIRESVRRFFALSGEDKERYRVAVGGQGWLPPGAEANGYAEGTQTPPDLKESYSLGADEPIGVPEIDEEWFKPNVWPAALPGVRAAVEFYMGRMRGLSDELLIIFAVALGLEPGYFVAHTGHPTFTFNIGDLMARWTGVRWRSTRHRVLPPPESAPEEDLVSLIWFYETDPLSRIASLAPPIGRRDYPEVVAHEYLMNKINAITVG